MINRNDIKRLIEAHGVEETLDICFEECGELVQAISKAKRKRRSFDDAHADHISYELRTEMADVLICMEMLKEIFDISDHKMEIHTKHKMRRNMRRIGEADEQL